MLQRCELQIQQISDYEQRVQASSKLIDQLSSELQHTQMELDSMQRQYHQLLVDHDAQQLSHSLRERQRVFADTLDDQQVAQIASPSISTVVPPLGSQFNDQSRFSSAISAR